MRRSATTLGRLFLYSSEPFGPELLFGDREFPQLRNVTVPRFAEHREAWIDWAVAHPTLGVSFVDIDEDEPAPEVIEVHRGLMILKVRSGRKWVMEVADDFAGLLEFDGNNGDVEDRVREHMPELGPDELSSESDTLIFQARNKTLVKKFIDRVFEIFKSEG
ncbi:MAG: hypothetical protein AB8G99_02040 [Planctomycetaceae bacterium]